MLQSSNLCCLDNHSLQTSLTHLAAVMWGLNWEKRTFNLYLYIKLKISLGFDVGCSNEVSEETCFQVLCILVQSV